MIKKFEMFISAYCKILILNSVKYLYFVNNQMNNYEE